MTIGAEHRMMKTARRLPFEQCSTALAKLIQCRHGRYLYLKVVDPFFKVRVYYLKVGHLLFERLRLLSDKGEMLVQYRCRAALGDELVDVFNESHKSKHVDMTPNRYSTAFCGLVK